MLSPIPPVSWYIALPSGRRDWRGYHGYRGVRLLELSPQSATRSYVSVAVICACDIPARYDAALPFSNCRALVCAGCHPLRWSTEAPNEAACTGGAFLID